MDHPAAVSHSPVAFETSPETYRHWKIRYEGEIAHVDMNVDVNGGLRPGYELKLNSYDLGVDIELADIVRRMRFEHPEVRVVLLGSANDRVFCAGANIHMLGLSTHGWKVNFCKFTNETRCEFEDATENSAQVYVAACNGTTAGGGYELALACKEIYLQDDGSSAVSLPEVPLLGVLPGTGGLTRLVDKRKVRRDLADIFSTTAEGVRGKRAVDWNLVDGVFPRSKFQEKVLERARILADGAKSGLKSGKREGVKLPALSVEVGASGRKYSSVDLSWNNDTRIAELTIHGPTAADLEVVQKGGAAIHEAGAKTWALRAYRELDDALLHLRVNHPSVGLVLVRAKGDAQRLLSYDSALVAAKDHWFVHEIILHMARVLRRMDLTSRSFFALGDEGAAFVGSFYELAASCDRFYVLDDADRPVKIGVGPLNHGALPMTHGLSRLAVRFLGDAAALESITGVSKIFDPEDANEAGLVTMVLDEIDWDDDVRVAIEERASLSPDALTGMEANLRYAGPETGDSKIFARLTAWQNWIFIRPNATGAQGALTLYGRPERPHFDWTRV
jgi:benzoyl-CoA-dihydrodiol lyase